MAGYVKNRENNYEIKYLRKVLRQVDDRIQVPESVSADSLRHLLDDVEPLQVREVPRRRLSIQSGIAYAAAFALVVSLVYSTKFYSPDMISGGINIAESQSADANTILLASSPDINDDDIIDAGVAAQAPVAGLETSEAPVPDAMAEIDSVALEDSASADQAPSHKLGIGGSGKANLLLKQDEYSFYWRENDANDPDRTSPISFEVVDTGTQEIVTQTDVPLLNVAQSFALDDSLVFVGDGLDDGVSVYSYDVSAPDDPAEQNVFSQDGKLVGANLHDGVVRIVSLSDSAADTDVELLPNCVSSETCVITVLDPQTQKAVTKRFTGANGTVRLDGANAYISYTGQTDDGESRDYTAQILFDGMDIALGTVD